MVVKTQICAFSDAIIYPGHGARFIRRDGATLYFASSKTRQLFNKSIKPSKLTWTMAWRRLHKKDKREDAVKARKRRVVRVQRSFVGLSAEDIAAKKAEPPKVRAAAREAALKEAKERAAKDKEARKAAAKKLAQTAAPSQAKAQKGSHQTKGR